eukprot:UN24228
MSKKIFVGGIPSAVTEEEWRAYFNKFGSALEISLIKHRDKPGHKGFGFLLYEDDSVAADVVNSSHILGNKCLTVKYSQPKENDDNRDGGSGRGGFRKHNGERFFLGGIDSLTETDVRQYFTKYGRITDCFIMKQRGFGFITLEGCDSSQLLNNKHEIRGSEVRVQKAKRGDPGPKSQRQDSGYGGPPKYEYQPPSHGGYGMPPPQSYGYGAPPPGPYSGYSQPSPYGDDSRLAPQTSYHPSSASYGRDPYGHSAPPPSQPAYGQDSRTAPSPYGYGAPPSSAAPAPAPTSYGQPPAE